MINIHLSASGTLGVISRFHDEVILSPHFATMK